MMDTVESFRVGDWCVEPSRHVLLAPSGETIRLAPKTIEVLCLLASRHGHVVARSDILDQVWHLSNAGDDSLNNAISSLRTTFRDDKKNPLYIETIPKRGYRLAAPVQFEAGDVVGSQDEPIIKRTNYRRPVIGGVAMAAIVVATAFTFTTINSGPEIIAVNGDVLPVTAMPGVERDAQLSPNGMVAVFSHNSDIYTSSLASGASSKITNSSDSDVAPIWSPDGEEVAFIRRQVDGCKIIIKSVESLEARTVGGCARASFPALTWHPSRPLLAYAERNAKSGAINLNFLNIGTGEHQEIELNEEKLNTYFFRFSPQGDKIAFVRNRPGRDQLIYADLSFADRDNSIAPSGGFPTIERLVETPIVADRIDGIDWLNGHRLVASAASQYKASLLVYSLGAKSAAHIALPSDNPIFPSASQDGKSIIYSDAQFDMDIWLAAVDNQLGRVHQKVINSTKVDIFPTFSPDGSTFAFVSSRSGSMELWLADLDGSNARQLTSFASEVSRPIWSPDGNSIALSVLENGVFDLWIVSPKEERARRLTKTPDNEIATGWRPDNSAIVFDSDADSALSINEIDMRSQQTAVLLMNASHGQFAAGQSDLYYLRQQQPGIWRYDFQSGVSTSVVDTFGTSHLDAWVIGQKGIYFLTPSSNGGAKATLQPYSGSEEIDVGLVRNVAPFHYLSLSVVDGAGPAQILYGKTDRLEADLVLAKLRN